MLGVRHYQGIAIDLYQGDITQFVCDAMVNAANKDLAGGGGVDGAIHRAGGPQIMDECRKVGGCPTGKAVATSAGRLPAKKVIHGVGPIWQGGDQQESALLASTYQDCLRIADELDLRHIALPAISTGVYGYPLEQAATVSLKAIIDFIDTDKPKAIRRITLVLFSREHYQVFQNALFASLPES